MTQLTSNIKEHKDIPSDQTSVHIVEGKIGIVRQEDSLNEPGSKDRKDEDPFPFTMRSLLQQAWGMTLFFSSQAQQQDFGSKINDQFLNILKDADNDSINGPFLQNLSMTLAGSVRNLGIIRENHQHFIDFTDDQLKKKKQNAASIVDFYSFTGSGLFAKIVGFISAGSVATYITEYLTDFDLGDGVFLVFVVMGVLGVVLVTYLARWWVNRGEQKKTEDTLKDETKYWKDEYKDHVAEELLDLFDSIKKLMMRFYPEGTYKKIMASDELLNVPDKTALKCIICNEILPPDLLMWPRCTLDKVQPAEGMEAEKKPVAEKKTGEKMEQEKPQDEKAPQKENAET
jgi:hypothetical protein